MEEDFLLETGEDFDQTFLENVCRDVTGDPEYRVHFICVDCKIPWHYDTVLVSQALLRAKQDGCPLCKQQHRLVLTHHEALIKGKTQNIPDLSEFVVTCTF